MTKRVHFRRLSTARLKHLAAMRAAKARKRQERIAAGWRPEPKFHRDYPLEIGFRDRRSGEMAWVALRSARQARKLAALLLQDWQPTPPPWRNLGTLGASREQMDETTCHVTRGSTERSR